MRAFAFGRWRRLRAVVVAGSAVVLGATWLAAGGTNGAQAAPKTLATFNTYGAYAWTVPSGMGIRKITFTVYGASGGNVVYNSGPGVILYSTGGLGGEAKGTFKVKPGESFLVEVGGQGGSVNASTTTTGGSPGFNNLGGFGQSASPPGAGGGGASDVRIGGKGNLCATDHASCRLQDRIIVAGGGGGGGGGSAGSLCTPPDGADGGGFVSGVSPDGCTPQAQQNGELSQPPSYLAFEGYFGVGGTGGPSGSATVTGCGGGGSGWFGGQGSTGGSGGAGGSGYISALALSGSYPGGTHSGDGLVIITTP